MPTEPADYIRYALLALFFVALSTATAGIWGAVLPYDEIWATLILWAVVLLVILYVLVI